MPWTSGCELLIQSYPITNCGSTKPWELTPRSKLSSPVYWAGCSRHNSRAPEPTRHGLSGGGTIGWTSRSTLFVTMVLALVIGLATATAGLAQKMYEEQAQAAGADAGEAGAADGDANGDTVDAEFEEVDDAEKNKGEDEARRKAVETRNKGEQMVYGIEKTLEENKDKLPAEEVTNVQNAIDSLKEALKGDDADKIEQEMENLTKASHKIAEMAYQQAGGPAADAAGAAAGAA